MRPRNQAAEKRYGKVISGRCDKASNRHRPTNQQLLYMVQTEERNCVDVTIQ